MAGTMSNNVNVALTGNGTAGGYVTVADASQFALGAIVTLRGSTATAATYQIADINLTSNTIGLRAVYAGTPNLNGINYGLSDVSAYTTADSAHIYQPAQLIYSPFDI
jgi:hypothetical protein